MALARRLIGLLLVTQIDGQRVARRIVETRGAGHLTFEMLAEESGVTRGGITYHFPTKEDLLKALIEADIADWNAANEELGGQTGLHCQKACRMIGHVRSSLADQDDSHKRFVTGMVSAAMVDPDLLDPVRDHLAAEFGGINGEEYYDTLWQTNVMGTRNVLELQRKKGFRLIFASMLSLASHLKRCICFVIMLIKIVIF